MTCQMPSLPSIFDLLGMVRGRIVPQSSYITYSATHIKNKLASRVVDDHVYYRQEQDKDLIASHAFAPMTFRLQLCSSAESHQQCNLRLVEQIPTED